VDADSSVTVDRQIAAAALEAVHVSDAVVDMKLEIHFAQADRRHRACESYKKTLGAKLRKAAVGRRRRRIEGQLAVARQLASQRGSDFVKEMQRREVYPVGAEAHERSIAAPMHVHLERSRVCGGARAYSGMEQQERAQRGPHAHAAALEQRRPAGGERPDADVLDAGAEGQGEPLPRAGEP